MNSANLDYRQPATALAGKNEPVVTLKVSTIVILAKPADDRTLEDSVALISEALDLDSELTLNSVAFAYLRLQRRMRRMDAPHVSQRDAERIGLPLPQAAVA